MSEIERIAAEVERLEGPSREVDAAIKTLVGHAWDYAADWGSRGNDKPVAFAYTASLDAAMTLVPEGAFWSITMRGERRGGFHACCQLEGPLDWREAATPALALCAAALKARAHLEQHHAKD